MQSNYDAALAAVLVHEGGYVNHPADPGGATNKGITIAVWNAHRKSIGLPGGVDTLRALTIADAGQIYWQNYWNPIRGDELPPGVDYAVFDLAVNSGVGRARQFIRRTLGAAEHKGPITDQEIEALWSLQSWDNFIAAYCNKRLAFVMSLETWPTFGLGWSRRIKGVLAHATAMAPDDPAAYANALQDGRETIGSGAVAATRPGEGDGWSTWSVQSN